MKRWMTVLAFVQSSFFSLLGHSIPVCFDNRFTYGACSLHDPRGVTAY